MIILKNINLIGESVEQISTGKVFKIIACDVDENEKFSDVIITIENNGECKDLGLKYSYLNNIYKYSEKVKKLLDIEIENETSVELAEIQISKKKAPISNESKDVVSSFRGDYAFLSNFYVCEVEYNGIKYPCSESAFQAQKDPNSSFLFSKLNGSKAKTLGKKVNLRKDWDEVKVDIMREIVYNKFSQNYDLCKKLIATNNKELVEGNTWNDTFWGVCRGKGLNWLGQILMETRQRIMDEVTSKV